jgi:hypothetical protein
MQLFLTGFIFGIFFGVIIGISIMAIVVYVIGIRKSHFADYTRRRNKEDYYEDD